MDLILQTKGDVFEYACFSWKHHLLLGFQEQELNVDETITTFLVTLTKKLQTFQGKTWHNTMLTFGISKTMFSSMKDGKAFYQVSYCNSQMVITSLTCIRPYRGQLLQRIL